MDRRINQVVNRKFLALLLSAVCLSGCAKKDGETAVGRAPETMNPNTTWAQSVGIKANGVVAAQASEQSLFQDAIIDFVTGMLAPEYVGYVSATASGGTGFYFGAKVELQSGVVNTANTQQVNVRSDAKLYIELRDEFTGRTDSTGAKTPPITRGFSQASGYVQGNRAYLKFTDKYGFVEMEGTFDAQTFKGSFKYDNTTMWDGSGQGHAGPLGQFSVPTCQFFRCQ